MKSAIYFRRYSSRYINPFLKFFAKLPVVGPVFPTLRFMAVFSVLIMGVGALLYGAKFLITAVRKGEQTLVND
jgi:hypothetical protein